MIRLREKITELIISNKTLFTYFLLLRYRLIGSKAKKRREQNVVMLHSGRTGSTVLSDLISQHNNVHWDGEIYINYPKYLNFFTSDPLKFLIHRSYQHSNKIYGFELKCLKNQHLEMFIGLKIEEYIEELEKLGYKKFIFLKRKNLLRRYISIKQMLNGGALHTTTNIKGPKKLNIEVNDVWINKKKMSLVEYFKVLEEYFEEVDKVLADRDVLVLYYEDDIQENPLQGYQKICDFLKIGNENPKVKLKRTNPFTIKETIDNYEELEQMLNDTKYKWMLETDNIVKELD